MPQLDQAARLNLADALARDAIGPRYLFQRPRLAVAQTETQLDDLPLARGQRTKHFADALTQLAIDSEVLGYSSVGVNYPGSVDGLAALALAARETRRIKTGVGVIPLNTRGPDSIAAGVRANALPLDRLLLGVGSAGPGALKRVREGVAELRSGVAAPLFVAALGPRMCHIAGEVADGVLLNWLTPEHARRSAEWVNAGAAAAGPQPPVLFT